MASNQYFSIDRWIWLCSTGIRAVNSLPQSMENLSDNAKHFKPGLKNYLYADPFNCVEEYFNVNREWWTKLNQTLYCPTNAHKL